MSRSIKITADTEQLKKSILDISKMINKDLGKSKIELFTADTKKFLRTEAVAAADVLKRKLDGIKTSTEGHQRALAGVVKGSQEELKLKIKILEASKHVVETEKQLQETQKASINIQQSAFARQFQKMSGYSAMMKGLQGISGGGGAGGMLGGIAGLGVAGAVGALAYGGSRVVAGRETWKGGVQDRLSLAARGGGNLEPENMGRMANAGLDAQSMRAARLQSMDVFGAGGSTERSVVQRAGFERAHGIEEGTMTGIGAGLRPSMGGAQANQTVMKLQAALIASGIKDAIGPYLETAAGMLTDLNEKGFTMDDSVLSLFTQMTKTGMGEGRSRTLMTGADQSIRGSSGESNAFYQSVFHRAGIGGNTIGGSQAAMQMGGLYGADLSKYKAMSPEDKAMFGRMGIGGAGHMQKVSGSLLDMIHQSSGGMKGDQGRLAQLKFMQNLGLAKDPGQAAEVETLLKKASKGGTVKEQMSIQARLKDIQDENKDPNLSELKKINSSTAGVYDILQKTSKSQLDLLGEISGPAFNMVDKLLLSIDGGILALAKFITGYETDEERQNSQQGERAEQQNSGKRKASKMLSGDFMSADQGQDMKDIQTMDYSDQMEFGKGIKAKMEGVEGKKNKGFGNLYNSDSFKSIRAGIEGEERKKAREANDQMRSGMMSTPSQEAAKPQYSTPVATPANKEQTDLLRRLVGHAKVTADNSKDRGGLPAATSSTTGAGN